MSFKDWSAIALANSTLPGINWAEGQSPASINNSARQVMADLVVSLRAGYNPLDYGAVGDGVTDDTAAIQAAIDATPFGGTVVLIGNGKVYATTGVNTEYAMARNIVGVGSPVLKALPGATILLDYRGSATYPIANKVVEGIKFDGAIVPNVVGMKFGSALSSLVQATIRDCLAINCWIGFWNYSSQSIRMESTFSFFNRIGYVIEQDPTNGGATICSHDHMVVQYNYMGVVINGLGTYPMDTMSFDGGEFQANFISQVAGWNITQPCEISNSHVEAPTFTQTFGCDTTNGSSIVTYARNPSGEISLWPGAGLTGVGIQPGTIITAITATNFTISLPATVTGSPTLTTVRQPITYGARSLLVAPMQFTASNVNLSYVAAGVDAVGVTLTGGANVLGLTDHSGFSGGLFVDGALSDKVSFYGETQLNLQINAYVDRWPDTITTLDAPSLLLGKPSIMQTKLVPNRYTTINPKVPVFNNVNAATTSVFVDPTAGPVAAAQFTAAAGSIAGNYVTIDFTPAPGVVAGERWGHMVAVRADTPTNIVFRNDFTQKTVAVDTQWRLLKIFYTATATTIENQFFWPLGTDAPKIYFSSVMSVKAAAGASLAALGALLSDGVWNDGQADGGLLASAAVVPPLIGSKTFEFISNVTVPGAQVGQIATVTVSPATANVFYSANVSAANTVAVYGFHSGAGSVTPAPGTALVRVSF